MDRIVVVMDAGKPAQHVMDFACTVAIATKSGITTLLIENEYNEPVSIVIDNQGYFCCAGEVKTMVRADTEQTVRLFRDRCRQDRITMEVCVTRGEPANEVLFNSKFADLLIMDPSLDFYQETDDLPSHFIREVLSNSECPVMLAPLSHSHFDEIDFCYDGTASSVFAIKQFTYLFPAFSNRKAMLVEVKETRHEKLEKTERKMMDWLRTHYNSADYCPLMGKPGPALFDYLFMKKNRIVVMGSYGREFLSQLFRESTADEIIRSIDLPIFIAHH